VVYPTPGRTSRAAAFFGTAASELQLMVGDLAWAVGAAAGAVRSGVSATVTEAFLLALLTRGERHETDSRHLFTCLG
jgi:hypothetical protein